MQSAPTISRPLLALTALLGTACATLGQHATERVLIDDELERHIISELRFEPGAIEYLRQGRREARALDGSVVAVTEPSGRAPRARESWIELADGQRLVGSPLVLGTAQAAEISQASDQPGLVWSTPLLGSVRIPLEALQRVVLREQAESAPLDELNDVVVLSNGDQARGLLERLWPDVVLDVDGQQRTFQLNGVASISLANPPMPDAGSRVWLSDGSIVSAESLLSDENGVRLDPAEPITLLGRDVALVTMSEVLAVAFESGGVVPIASLGLPDWEPLSPWAIAPSAQDADRTLLGAAQVELVGAVEASWSLPSNTRRVALRARLREDCRVWGDCVLTVSVGDRVEQPVTINDRNPEVGFTIDLPGGTERATLSVRLDEGANGPIQDRVMLDGFILLSSDGG